MPQLGCWSQPPAKIPGPWPAVRDPGVLKTGSCGLESLSGGGIRGPGPMGVVHGAGAMESTKLGRFFWNNLIITLLKRNKG